MPLAPSSAPTSRAFAGVDDSWPVTRRSCSRSSSSASRRAAMRHHGGAWKIAYADFVTAMMAFFLLMWLLGSTTEGDKKGIADYFSSPLQGRDAVGGSGAGDASHVIKGGGRTSRAAPARSSAARSRPSAQTVNLQRAEGRAARAEVARLEELKEQGRGRSSQRNPKLAALHVADPARHDARRPAHPDRRRAEPADVRQRQRAS